MKSVRFHPEAEAEVELAAQAKYYDERSAGLGDRFTREVEAAVELLAPCSLVAAHFYSIRLVARFIV